MWVSFIGGWLARVLTDEERFFIKSLALELAAIRRQLMEIAEVMVKMNDKKFHETFNVFKENFSEDQVDNYKLALQKKADAAEYEFR
jgi:hypothetical protein